MQHISSIEKTHANPDTYPHEAQSLFGKYISKFHARNIFNNDECIDRFFFIKLFDNEIDYNTSKTAILNDIEFYDPKNTPLWACVRFAKATKVIMAVNVNVDYIIPDIRAILEDFKNSALSREDIEVPVQAHIMLNIELESVCSSTTNSHMRNSDMYYSALNIGSIESHYDHILYLLNNHNNDHDIQSHFCRAYDTMCSQLSKIDDVLNSDLSDLYFHYDEEGLEHKGFCWFLFTPNPQKSLNSYHIEYLNVTKNYDDYIELEEYYENFEDFLDHQRDLYD